MIVLDREASEGRVTDVWRVRAIHGGQLLGTIKWFGRWRQYAFFPEPDKVFNPDCLDTVTAFIRKLMDERRRK